MNPIQSRIKLTQPPEFPRPWRAERVRNTIMVWVLAADGTPVCAVPCMETALIIARAPEVAGALEDILTGELVLTRDEDAALARAALHRV